MSKIYYGEETKKALENFHLGSRKVSEDLIVAISIIKKACALANHKIGRLDTKIKNAIVDAAEEVIQENHFDQFPLGFLQGGAGTSINMNVNEVIANRATEILDNKILVHSLDHVNLGQSTNDVIPTAFRIVIIQKINQYYRELGTLEKAFAEKKEEFWNIFKVGRTHLQDAVPIRFGQEFRAYESFVKRDRKRLKSLIPFLQEVNIGATSVGTGINTSQKYIDEVVINLNKITNLGLKHAEDMIDATQNSDTFIFTSGAVKASAIGLSKIMNDLRMMASGPRAGLGEIILPEVQKGSSIMPGKVNPVMLELINQIAFQVSGNDNTIAMAVEAGQFELNVMFPVLMNSLIESIIILKKGVRLMVQKALKGLKANQNRCQALLENSLCMATALNKHIGYDKTAFLVKKAHKENKSLKQVLLEEKLFKEKEIDAILNPSKLTEPIKN